MIYVRIALVERSGKASVGKVIQYDMIDVTTFYGGILSGLWQISRKYYSLFVRNLVVF